MELKYGEYQSHVDAVWKKLLNKSASYLSSKQVEVIKLAYNVSAYAHFHQRRKSGEPYIIHPIEVAYLIASWGLDELTIAGALLHDTIEDTSVTKADIVQIFGNRIADLVDSVTKLDKFKFNSEEEALVEYFKKMVLATAKDIRVILIKLADRTHNMATLGSMKPAKQISISRETMDIYVPIAYKIGLYKVFRNLSDQSFAYLNPTRYKIIAKAAMIARNKRLPIVENIITNISGALLSSGIRATFEYQERNPYSLYSRMKKHHKSFDEMYDIYEIKILVENISQCYLTMGVLHGLYKPIPGKFRDYIALPKLNGYQSLHLTLMGPNAAPIRIHIRTEEMDMVAETGIVGQITRNNIDSSQQDSSYNWINSIIELDAAQSTTDEFVNSIKQDLSVSNIYTFTPKGKLILLPKDSNGLDFAYAIHTQVGNKCYQVKINEKISKLTTKLQHGDIVEVITNPKVEPTRDWLKVATSTRAINRIKQFLKEQKYDEDVAEGTKLLRVYLDILMPYNKINIQQINIFGNKELNKTQLLDMLQQIGSFNLSALEAAKTILGISEKIELRASQLVNIDILQDAACYALPGDDVYIEIKSASQIIMHKINCVTNKHTTQWNRTRFKIIDDIGLDFRAKVVISLINKPLAVNNIIAIFSSQEINIEALHLDNYKKYSVLTITIDTNNAENIKDLIALIGCYEEVKEIYRV